MMETTYTLIFWVMMGWRFEEAQLPRLGHDQCAAFRDEMSRERAPLRVACVADPPRRPIYEMKPDDRCFICGHQEGKRV
jgi:hypothetical protein